MNALKRNHLFDAALVLASIFGAAAHSAPQREQIQIVGSSTVFPFSTTVAERFARLGKYKAPVVESTGTGGGFKLFCDGVGLATPDINDASRPITDGERATCARNGVTAVDEFRIGYDGIILAGPAGSANFNITLEQLWRAAAKTVPVSGKWVANPYRTWREIAPTLPDKAIHLYGPAPNHGTRDAFVELVMEPSCKKAAEGAGLGDNEKKICDEVREDQRWIDVSEDYALVMGKLAGTPDAMAIFTFSYLDQNPDKIQAATVNGVKPTLETISSGQYPIARPLFVYLKRAHVGVIPGLRKFVSEFLSDRAAGADGYLAEKGLIPLPRPDLQAQQAAAKKL